MDKSRGKPKDKSRDKPEYIPRDKPGDKGIRDKPKDKPKDKPRDKPRDSKGTNQGINKGTPQGTNLGTNQGTNRYFFPASWRGIKGQTKEQTKGQTKGQIKGQTRGHIKGQTKGQGTNQGTNQWTNQGLTKGQIKRQTKGQTRGQPKGQTRGQTIGQTKGQARGQGTDQGTNQGTNQGIRDKPKDKPKGKPRDKRRGQTKGQQGDKPRDKQGDTPRDKPGDKQVFFFPASWRGSVDKRTNQGTNQGTKQGTNQGTSKGTNQGINKGDKQRDKLGDRLGDKPGDKQTINPSTMKLFVVLLLAAVAYGARYEKATTKIPGSFLIKVKDGVSLNGFVSQFENQFAEGKVNSKWDNINTISVHLPEALVERLLALDAIEYVEEDGVFYTQAVGSWGIDRVDQRNLPLDNTYNAPRSGSGQTVYIIDTGIRHSHNDYGGRASYHWDYQSSGEDCNGHGTHCAGTAAGSIYGICESCNLKSIRVLSCQGSGSTTNIVNGVNSMPNNGGVGSMSLGGGASSSLDNVVNNAVNRGIVMSVAAGNSNANACNYSPAREPSAITVGSTESNDARSSFSNYGSCVDIFAPGSSITSTWHTSNSATNTISGTSMACPHVSGAAALLLARGVSAGLVPSTMVNEATGGVVGNPGWGSPNEFLYVGL
ncbi:uncharacterized protein [Amphiura filiformis]|uniref:uncharacterized protein n=1 Tax=Amphiura filiformis TaxID=82378 RepID=UPI003B2159C5